MNEYRHHVSGFFALRADAERVRDTLVERGLPRDQVDLFDSTVNSTVKAPVAGSNEVLRDVLVDGAIGTAVGTGIGALAQVALVAANVSLFIASPLIAPLAMLGWGASLGGLIGAAAGAETKQGGFSALVSDAISSGQFVVVAHTRSARETAMARGVIVAVVGTVTDLKAA
jgi:hypothetical protein